jgi:arylsulfatase A-like enzyme
MWKDTAVFYTSDHGELLGDFGDFCKSCFLEPSARVPLIARLPRWMSTATGQPSSALVELADLYPTLLEVGGAKIPGDIDGRSLMPILTGQASEHRDHLHGQISSLHMFHDGRYKYLYCTRDGRELLFDMETDPGETRDLSADAPLLASLRQKFVAHLAAEKHEHLVDGAPLNEHRTLSPRNQRSPIDWLGWAGTASGI